jgi:hypothetical protein
MGRFMGGDYQESKSNGETIFYGYVFTIPLLHLIDLCL